MREKEKKNWKNLLREIIRFDNVRDTLNRLKRSIEILYRWFFFCSGKEEKIKTTKSRMHAFHSLN